MTAGVNIIDPLTLYSLIAPILFIPILLFVGLILLFILKKNKGASHRIVLIDLLFILFIVLSSGAIKIWDLKIRNMHPILTTKQFLNLEIPYSVHQLADDHFIQIAGESYFRKNFAYNTFASEKYNNGTYRISYQFLPLKNILGSYSLFATVEENRVVDASYFPYCISGGSECQINITKKEIMSIEKQYHVSNGFTFEPPYLKTTLCDGSMYKGVLLVNYITKEVNVSDNQFSHTGPILISPCMQVFTRTVK